MQKSFFCCFILIIIETVLKLLLNSILNYIITYIQNKDQAIYNYFLLLLIPLLLSCYTKQETTKHFCFVWQQPWFPISLKGPTQIGGSPTRQRNANQTQTVHIYALVKQILERGFPLETVCTLVGINCSVKPTRFISQFPKLIQCPCLSDTELTQ